MTPNNKAPQNTSISTIPDGLSPPPSSPPSPLHASPVSASLMPSMRSILASQQEMMMEQAKEITRLTILCEATQKDKPAGDYVGQLERQVRELEQLLCDSKLKLANKEMEFLELTLVNSKDIKRRQLQHKIDRQNSETLSQSSIEPSQNSHRKARPSSPNYSQVSSQSNSTIKSAKKNPQDSMEPNHMLLSHRLQSKSLVASEDIQHSDSISFLKEATINKKLEFSLFEESQGDLSNNFAALKRKKASEYYEKQASISTITPKTQSNIPIEPLSPDLKVQDSNRDSRIQLEEKISIDPSTQKWQNALSSIQINSIRFVAISVITDKADVIRVSLMPLLIGANSSVPATLRAKVWPLVFKNWLGIGSPLYSKLVTVRRKSLVITMQPTSTNKSPKSIRTDGQSQQKLSPRKTMWNRSNVTPIAVDLQKVRLQIDKDLVRSKGVANIADQVRELLELLHIFRPDISYVQGMIYPSALLVQILGLQDAWLVFTNLVVGDPFLRRLFSFQEGFPTLCCRAFESLISEKLAKMLSSIGIISELYLVEWFYTLFCRQFNRQATLILWDWLAFEEPIVVLFGVAKALVKSVEPKLKAMIEASQTQEPTDLETNEGSPGWNKTTALQDVTGPAIALLKSEAGVEALDKLRRRKLPNKRRIQQAFKIAAQKIKNGHKL